MGCAKSKQPLNRDTLHKHKFGDAIDNEKEELKIKLCMAGDTGVGKSLFYHTFFDTLSKFTNTTTPPNGDNNCKRLNVPGTGKVLLSIWDTAGQERYMAITKIFYKGADGVVILYNVTSRASFNRIEGFWLKELKDEINVSNCAIILVGNCIDLPNRVVTSDEGEALATKFGMLYHESSALQGTGVKESINKIVEKIIARQNLKNN